VLLTFTELFFIPLPPLKYYTSSYNPNGNGGGKGVDVTIMRVETLFTVVLRLHCITNIFESMSRCFYQY
jgi:hypothetical protein